MAGALEGDMFIGPKAEVNLFFFNEKCVSIIIFFVFCLKTIWNDIHNTDNFHYVSHYLARNIIVWDLI